MATPSAKTRIPTHMVNIVLSNFCAEFFGGELWYTCKLEWSKINFFVIVGPSEKPTQFNLLDSDKIRPS